MNISPFILERFFAEYEFNVPYLLCSSDCESISIKDLLQFENESLEKLENVWLGYTESQGAPSLLNRIASLYTSIKANDVLTFSGAEEAIYIFMRTMLKHGENIIVQAPCYQSLFEVAKSEGVEIKQWNMDKDNAWELDINELENLIDSKTKAIVINFPNNPTGYLPTIEKYQQIVSIAKRNDLLLFSDEVYRLFEYDEADRLTPACELYDKAVSLGVLSKSFGLAGLRIGWIACKNQDIMEQLKCYKDYTTICNSAPSEFLAEIALKNTDKLIGRNKQIALKNLDLIKELFTEFSSILSWNKPKAGVIAFPKFSEDVAEKVNYRKIAEDYGLLLLPGSCYGYPDNYFRIGYGRKNFPEAIAVFRKYLNEKFN
ncbi:aminotransferase class I/II-fold pyridoxal phosphate-dependent enzyme [Chondrinema litorale]|uniref:aminotransferase class I/II-fold pyridoxal phosphate-dependent enzyme n=1 Tax=Chondrinema litorale TaxID=2994555 RepID=UPI002542F23A|nr:aminotransferase class I/II-fold pyridoxal phosphate-dependent enzyme [Chondrinema litorale]UZR95806.1 aminotransferase class I/II-fold pyridoxal phosphate-dependent enzyme [Chondrinema litorale]